MHGRWRRGGRRTSLHRQRIPGVAQGADAVQRLQFFAQAAHHNVDRAGVQLSLMPTQVVEDVVAAEDFASKAPNKATAKAFTDYVLSADGASILAAAGFARP